MEKLYEAIDKLCCYYVYYFFHFFHYSGIQKNAWGGIGLTEYFLLTITGENPYSVHLWYLLTTFLIVITCYVVLKISSKTHHDEMIVLFILAFVLWNIRILWGEDFCMTVKSYLKYSIFFVLGMILNKKRIDVPQKYYLLLSFISWVYIFIYSTDMIKTTMFLYRYLKNACERCHQEYEWQARRLENGERIRGSFEGFGNINIATAEIVNGGIYKL